MNLPQVAHNCSVIIYANDTSLFRRTKYFADLTDLNRDLHNLDNWLLGNRLSLNVLKINCMLLANYQNHKSLTGQLGLKCMKRNFKL